MTESSEQTAPILGDPTDAQDVDNELELDADEQTIDTPDELGGTGGEQAGGAG
jgi:hypothetical protein